MTVMQPGFQHVSLVARGGTPVTVCDAFGNPYPTTGYGSLVFNQQPTFIGATLQGGANVDQMIFQPGAAAAPSAAIGTPDTGFYGLSSGDMVGVSVHDTPIVTATGAGISVTGDIQFTGQLIGNTASTVTVLSTLADIKNLPVNQRPTLVATSGALTPGDGGGGSWRWDPTDVTTTPNDGTVVQPTSLPNGRYKRVYTGNVQMGWWPISAGGDVSTQINQALALGTTVELTPNATLRFTLLTFSVAGTVLLMNGATLQGAPGATGFAIRMQAQNCKLLGPGTIDYTLAAYGDAVSIEQDGCWYRDVTSIGVRFKPRTPMAVAPTPIRHVSVRVPGNTALLANVVVTGNRFIGGNNGFFAGGMKDGEVSNNWGVDNVPGLAFNYNGAGMPIIGTKIRGNSAIGSGYYGHSVANLTSAATSTNWNVPLQDLYLYGIESRHCGWADYFGNTGQAVGTAKMGMDWTTTHMQRGWLDFKGYNNLQGGLEVKRSTAFAGIVYAGPAFNSLYAKCHSTHAMDTGVGFTPCIGDSTDASSDYRYCTFDSDTFYLGCPAWAAGVHHELWSPVKSNGWNWLCLGDVNGNPGQVPTSGGVAPTGGGFALTTTNGTVSSGTSIVVTNATGIAAGQTVFCNQTTSGNIALVIPDGVQVHSSYAGGTTIPLTGSIVGTIPSGTAIMFAKEAFDGALYWRSFQATPAGACSSNITAISVAGIDSVTVRGTAYNTRWGVVVDTYIGTDKSATNIVIDGFRAKGVGTGVTVQASSAGGTSSVDLLDCHITADSDVLTGGFTNTNAVVIQGQQTCKLRVFGGFLLATGTGSVQAIRGINSTGNYTVELYGGVHVESPNGLYFDDGGNTYTVLIENADIQASNCLQIGGTYTVRFGGNATYAVTGIAAGTAIFGGTGTVSGSPFRRGLTTAPTSGVGGTRGYPGERMALAVPTATEWGYICTAANVGANTYTWGKIPVT